jgi:uncharacterized protein YjbI with pentapeptide repeats
MRKMPLVVLACAIVGVLLIGGYLFHWNWTGFPGKTLWDWFQPLGIIAIPVAVAFGTVWFSQAQHQSDQRLADQQAKREREIAFDNQREAVLKEYIESMSKLLLDNNLIAGTALFKLSPIVHVRTIILLPRLDGNRKGIVLQFLHETGFLSKNTVNLDGADFSGAALLKAQLSKSDLSKANLMEANLVEANLVEVKLDSTILKKANLSYANLFGAELHGVDLSEANLKGAIGITVEELEKQAKSLQGATMPDGTKHD